MQDYVGGPQSGLGAAREWIAWYTSKRNYTFLPLENWFFESAQSPTSVTRPLDPRILSNPRYPWMLQVGLIGKGGDHVVFEDLRFERGCDKTVFPDKATPTEVDV